MPSKSNPRIDLNLADEKTLIKKLDISPRLARRIIAFRPYQSVDQITKLWGIDPQVLQRILPLITINEQEAAPAVIPEKTPAPIEPAAALEDIKPVSAELSSAAASEKESKIIEGPDWSISSLLSKVKLPPFKVNVLLILIILVGAYFRFTGLNWDQGQHQHPDERFISMVAEQIRGVDGFASYFDTENSTLNPLRFGSYTYGMFPLFLTRMVAEWVEMSGYDTVTIVGRAMSGLFDLLAVLMIYFLGKRLYDKRVGLLAAALGVAAVLPIQLSHYFTVDSFSTIFVIGSFYFATLAIPIHVPEQKISQANLVYFGFFGFVVGLAGACKVNTLPVFGIIVLAGIAMLITEWNKPGFWSTLKTILWGWALAALFVCLAFRVFQPYAFSGPGFFGLTLNENWLRVIKEVVAQVAGESDWPPNTHWTDRSTAYAWINMVTWGLGIPLGLAGWFGWAWAGGQIFDGKWRSHLLPFFWVAAYFIWQNIQFWRYMRYFLPIYPFIILFAAWALLEIYDRTSEGRRRLVANGTRFAAQVSDWRFTWSAFIGLFAIGAVVLGTFIYALAFTQIYQRPMTRIAASEWMLENIPGPMNLIVESSEGMHSYPVSIDNLQVASPGNVGSTYLNILEDGTVSKITATDISQIGVNIYFRVTRDVDGNEIITEGRLAISDDNAGGRQEISFGNIKLTENETYFLHYKIQSSSQFLLSNVRLQNADQNEGSILPIELNIASQAPGVFEGSFVLEPKTPLSLNRLVIEEFQQVFTPTQSILKLSIYKRGEEDKPLMESSQTLEFSEPGISIAPTFSIPPVKLTGGQEYQVRYEVMSGAPLQFAGTNFTLETSWDDALPLNINKFNAQGGIFNPLNLELYEPDTPEKREMMIQVLDKSDYIVIPSNRAYDAMPRLPLRYPLTLKYYQTLFDCTCSGDALENLVYDLKPPFKSPLGFDLIATFESPPSIGFLVFPDQSADESFTVYDHPKVLIFKKSQDFSIDRVRDTLNTVNLDEVFFQTPMQFTKNPTAMQLPADRLAAQTSGGTWSEIFNRNSILNNNDLLAGVAWYLLLFFIGLVVFPFVFNIFSGLPDRGYPLIRMAGLVLIAWLAWFLGSFKLVSFSQFSLWIYVALILILSMIFAYRHKNALLAYIRSHWKLMLWTELIFAVLFSFDLVIRLGNPDIWHPWLGGEKPMDFTFFNAVLKAVYFPPQHPWFSGHYINYYYYGYVIAAIPTKLLGVIPSMAYNLILPSWFAMTGIGIFCIAYNLVDGLKNNTVNDSDISLDAEKSGFLAGIFKRNILAKNQPFFAGIFVIVFVLLLGNLYQVRVLWKYLPEAIRSETPVSSSLFGRAGAVFGGAMEVLTNTRTLPGDNGRWYFEASRPILHDGPDTPIAEFPYFTFLYGDLHPHLLIMPFYALALGWMINLMLRSILGIKWTHQILYFLAAGLFFGIFRGSHTWDFPTFFGLGALVILWNIWNYRGDSVKKTIQLIIFYEFVFVIAVMSLYWPFTQWFKTEYAAVEFWSGARTPLFDYLFVFGLSLFIGISLMVLDLKETIKESFNAYIRTPFNKWTFLHYFVTIVPILVLVILWQYDFQVLAFGIPFLFGVAYLVLFNHNLSLLRKLIWVLFGIGLSITLFVEVFVLKGDGGRSNTVFRFYNQAWFFLGLAMSLALIELLNNITYWRSIIKYTWSFALGVLILCAASYPLIATNRKMTDRWPDIKNPPHSLDGAVYMLGDASNSENRSPAIYNDDSRPLNLSLDYDAILYLQDHIKGSPVIVEGHTEEYRWGSRISIYTGLPSVIGWSWHVRQHNSLLDGAIVEKRIAEVDDFYNTEDISIAAQFLKKYEVKYIIIGDLERAYYAANGFAKFAKMSDQGLLKMIFGDNTSNTTSIFEVLVEP